MVMTGFSTAREVTQATFRFVAVPAANVQTVDFTQDVRAVFTPWFGGDASTPFGSQFTYTQPFTIQGNQSAVTAVTVTLTNSLGASQPVTAPIP